MRQDGEGERLWFYGGGLHTWKATSEETDGAFLLFEDLMERGKTTPLHIHANEDETIYVLECEILVHVDGDEPRLGEGGVAVAPRGVPHAFMVTSDAARMLCLQTPGSAGAFYRGASEPAAEPGPSGPVDFERVRACAESSGGMQVVGPPPFTAAR